MANRGLQFAGFYISPEVLVVGSAAAVVIVGTKLMADMNSQSAFTNLALEGQQIAATTVRIEERVAQIIEKLSVFKQQSLEARMKHRAEMVAIIAKYRPQIVAALAAFRTKLRAFLDNHATRDEFEKAKADLRMQIIDIVQLIVNELHQSLRVNLQEVKKRIQDQRNAIANLQAQGPPWL